MARWMTIKQKRAIIKKATASPWMSQSQLAEWAKCTFRLAKAPAQNTISDLLKRAFTIMDDAYGDDQRRKPLQVTSIRLENRLWEWIQHLESMNVCVSRELITMKARALQGQLCDAWDLSFSDGWLTAFEHRHGLRLRERFGEAASADPDVVRQGQQLLQEMTDLYEPEDIYNMDETGLCYAMAPARSICTKKTSGVKKNKTRITLALTANAAGTDVLPVLFLGRAERPRCFERKTGEDLGFHYKANKKAWMTGVVFRDWLRGFDRDMRSEGRHVLLLLDNASSHSQGDLALTNVKVHFLPPNTTAFLQPMDAGIISAFKKKFRRKQLKWVYDKIESNEPIGKKPYAIDQLQAMRWSEEIWLEIRGSKTIKNCFGHTRICSNGVTEDSTYSDGYSYGDDVDVCEVIVRASSLQL